MEKKILVKDLRQTQANIFLTQKKKIEESKVNFTAFFKWVLVEHSEEYVRKDANGILDVFEHEDKTKAVKPLPLEQDYRDIIEKNKISLAKFTRWAIDKHLDAYIKKTSL